MRRPIGGDPREEPLRELPLPVGKCLDHGELTGGRASKGLGGIRFVVRKVQRRELGDDGLDFRGRITSGIADSGAQTRAKYGLSSDDLPGDLPRKPVAQGTASCGTASG